MICLISRIFVHLVLFELSDDGSGWETVQRGGKSRSRNSLENLSTVGKPLAGLTRTLSDPHSSVIKRNRGNFHAMRKSVSDGNHANKNVRKDSEKENEPVKNQREKQDSAKSNSPHVNHNRHSYSGTVKGASAQNKPAVIGNSRNVNKDTKINRERPQSLTESKVVTSTKNVRNINSPRGEGRAATPSASKPPVPSKVETVDKASPQNTLKKYELDSVKTDFKKLQKDLSECKDEEDLSKIDDVRLTFEYRYLCFFCRIRFILYILL